MALRFRVLAACDSRQKTLSLPHTFVVSFASEPEPGEGKADVIAGLFDMLKTEVPSAAAELPQKRKQLETELANVIAQADRYADLLGEPGKDESPRLRQKLEAAEARQRRLEAELRALPPTSDICLPDESWVLGELAHLSALLKERSIEAMALIRRMIGRIDADAIVAPGKKRGFCRLRFTLDLPGVVNALLQEKLPVGIRTLIAVLPNAGGERVAVEVNLRPLLETEQWADDIYAWRQQTPPVPWNEIRRSGGKLTLATCMIVYKRYCKAMQPPPIDPPAAA